MPRITLLTEPQRLPLSAMLAALAADESRERIAVGDLLAALGDRALAALLFVFAFPNVLPMPPGTSAVLGAPLVFLAAQLAFGRAPWLPAVIASRSMTRADFAALVARVGPWLARAERLLRPRLSLLAAPPMEYAIGLLCLLLALVLVLPVPLGNMLPALAVSLLALGVLERDGVWVLAGFATSVIAAFVVSGVVWAMVKAAVYFVTKVLGFGV
ncbi:ABC transporter permease [Rubrivivax gelatinosus]|uniref:exopolysaccharide biosynthesis protein n=1 Tax=Rubrivivax gelatinosus TaxID=28068 RepID=UPI0019086B99|nr:exopolysaccharide biosynthesis protein [Rubrivivax gelatinosus]MBK1613839.1 ABC transporter permease [Rubrivivax gelatinosus]